MLPYLTTPAATAAAAAAFEAEGGELEAADVEEGGDGEGEESVGNASDALLLALFDLSCSCGEDWWRRCCCCSCCCLSRSCLAVGDSWETEAAEDGSRLKPHSDLENYGKYGILGCAVLTCFSPRRL